MEATLQSVCFIIENVETNDLFQRFSVYLKVDDYEWLKVGEFVKTDLPYGINFPILINRQWLENPEVEMMLEFGKGEMTFEGILEMEKDIEGKLSVSGVATLFDTSRTKRKSEISVECTIFVDDIKQQASIRHQETQTSKVNTRNIETQISPDVEEKPLTVSVATSTDGNFVEMEEFRKILEKKMAEKIREVHANYRNIGKDQEETSMNPEIEDPKPSDIIVSSNQNENMMNSYNLVPRMTRLKQLDQMILEKTKLVEKLDLEIEMKRKLKIIVEKRNDLKMKEAVGVKKDDAKEKELKDESETSKESTSSESSYESEEVDEEQEEDDSEEEKEESAVPEGIVERKGGSEVEVESKNQEKEEENDESKIEDPFSPQSIPQPAPIVSPTTQYLENLRQKILDQYNSKIS